MTFQSAKRCLFTLVLSLFAATTATRVSPDDRRSEIGIPIPADANSLADWWPELVIPVGGEPDAAAESVSKRVSGTVATSATVNCPPFFELPLISSKIARYVDTALGVTELFNHDYNNNFSRRFRVHADLSYEVDTLPLAGGIWLAEDLDRDGDVDLVVQVFETLSIYSAPNWNLRKAFVWPGFQVEMNPTAVNIDADRFLELYVTPNTLGGSAMTAIIKYDSVSQEFIAIENAPAPNGAVGRPAVGDFDDDGRVEFISGNNKNGYELFEWTGTALAHIGLVGDVISAECHNATACRPKPGFQLHALLGQTSIALGHRYQLLQPTGDNTFDVVRVFQVITGASSGGWLGATDTDCDGLDELAMHFSPADVSWRWDNAGGDFVEVCSWDPAIYGSLVYWPPVDLNQDGSLEWSIVRSPKVFGAYPGLSCGDCDTVGYCPWGSKCICVCASDPVCDSVTNVLDVVSAVGVAFKGTDSPTDPFGKCPFSLTDVDCNGFTNILDIVHFVNVAFRSADPATEFCDPCP